MRQSTHSSHTSAVTSHYHSFVTLFDCPNPWTLLQYGIPSYLWRDRESWDLWIGLGIVAETDSLDECRLILQNLELVGENTSLLPRCFGAVAFDAERPMQGEWEGFSARRFVLPAAVLNCHGKRATLFNIARVTGEIPQANLSEKLKSESERIQSRSRWSTMQGMSAQVVREAESFSRTGWRKAVEEVQDDGCGRIAYAMKDL